MGKDTLERHGIDLINKCNNYINKWAAERQRQDKSEYKNNDWQDTVEHLIEIWWGGGKILGGSS